MAPRSFDRKRGLAPPKGIEEGAELALGLVELSNRVRVRHDACPA